MAEKYCVFLRGINVNGIKIKMDALKEAFCKMGFTGVTTVLATGNVIVSAPEGRSDRRELKRFIENELSRYFGYDAHVILRSEKELMDVCAAARAMTVPEGCHNYLLLCEDETLPFELEQLFGTLPHAAQEQLLPAGCGAFWVVPRGSTLSSSFGSKVLGDKRYKNRLTSRNISTVEKICRLLPGQSPQR